MNSPTEPCVTIIIPAHNEAERVGQTIRALRSSFEAAHVTVVDDGSTDATEKAAQEAGADQVIRLQENRGKGAALAQGLAQARGHLVVFCDADLGNSASEMRNVAEPVLAGEADMSIAGFPRAGRRGGFGLAVKLARWGIRRRTGANLQWPLSGQRVLTLELARKLGEFAPGFGVEVGMVIDAARAGARIVEVETGMTHRHMGRTISGFVHRARQLWHVARALATERASR